MGAVSIMDAKQDQVDAIIGRSLVAAEAFISELRDELAEEVVDLSTALRSAEVLAAARVILDRWEPIAAQAITDAEIAAWIAGAATVINQLPTGIAATIGFDAASSVLRQPRGKERRATERQAKGRRAGKPQARTQQAREQQTREQKAIFAAATRATEFVDFDDSLIRFPLLENAANELIERRVVTRREFDQMANDAKERAFTVAYLDSEDTIGKIRDVLHEEIEQGASLGSFREKVDEAIGKSRLGDWHLETVYRTNIQASFHRGHDEIANDPTVAEVFPYQEYLPIDDGRVREEHLALEKLGLSGTGVYRRQDPFWDHFSPPWSFSCRCGVNLLTIEAAAKKGVAEAKQWMETGTPPPFVSRLPDIPFRPDPTFVGVRAR